MTFNVSLTFIVFVIACVVVALYCQSQSHKEEKESSEAYAERMMKKVISDLVLQMAQIITDNPKCLKVKFIGNDVSPTARTDSWEATYLETGDVFIISREITLARGYAVYSIEHNVIFNSDEAQHLFMAFYDATRARKAKHQSILRKRLERRLLTPPA